MYTFSRAVFSRELSAEMYGRVFMTGKRKRRENFVDEVSNKNISLWLQCLRVVSNSFVETTPRRLRWKLARETMPVCMASGNIQGNLI